MELNQSDSKCPLTNGRGNHSVCKINITEELNKTGVWKQVNNVGSKDDKKIAKLAR